VKTDPNVPPLPPHITLKEARGLLSAMGKGDAGLLATLGNAAHGLIDKLVGPK
jgi:pyruvate dehydrogenase (quinone)